jgi:sigma-B regulation protein RsbU (phosphoserine phosphatase)
MAITHAVAHLHPGGGAEPGELLGFVNHQLTRLYTGNSGTFVTAFYAVYDARRRTLAYASAGHNPPRVRRCGAPEVIPLEGAGGLPLGIEGDELYAQRQIQLRPGDTLAFYTDGITEARDPEGAMFGTERLDAALVCRATAATDALDSVMSKLRDFCGPRAPGDDQTLLIGVVR